MNSPDSANTMTAKIKRPPLESHESTLNSASTTPRVAPARNSVQAVGPVLLDNALVYGHGDVTIDVEDLRSGVRIRVSDQGSTATITADTDKRWGYRPERSAMSKVATHSPRRPTQHLRDFHAQASAPRSSPRPIGMAPSPRAQLA